MSVLEAPTSLGPKFGTFSAKYLKHTSGVDAGKPFVLEPWQVDWVNDLLTQEDGRFIYQQALLGIARGNGKSALASALCLFALFYLSTSEPGAEVYALANSLPQSRIVFGVAKKMLEASPLNDYAKSFRDAIEVPSTGAVFRALPAGYPEKLHGLKPFFFVSDELHGMKDRELWDVMTTAQIKRPGSLGVGISTAGFDLNSLLGELYERGESGEDGFLFKWFSASDPEDPETWKEANPSSWITQELLERQSKRMPPAVFHRLHLNRWTRSVELWLPQGSWAACESPEDIPDGASIFVGLDLGFKTDHTAVVEVMRDGDRYVTRSTIFATHVDPSKPRPLAHYVFENERQHHQAVLGHILELSKRNPITELVYDPFGATLMIEELEGHGIPCVEFPQTNKRMCQATDILYELIRDEHLAHNGDEAFSAHIEATTTRWVGDGIRLWKTPDKQPMDSAIALAIATQRAHAVGDTEFNFYPL